MFTYFPLAQTAEEFTGMFGNSEVVSDQQTHHHVVRGVEIRKHLQVSDVTSNFQ